MLSLKYVRCFNSIPFKLNLVSKICNYNLNFSHGNQFLNFETFKTQKLLCTDNFNHSITEATKITEAFSNLDSNYKQQLRINRKDIELLTKSIEQQDTLHEENYLLLLHCCGQLLPDELPSTRISLVQKAWQALMNKNINLTVNYYNALLQCYVENRMKISHKEFLSKMKCEPNEFTFNLLLECVAENGDLYQAVEIVNLMKDKGLAANESVFSSLILCHLRCGDVQNAENILETMRIAQLNLGSVTYTALLRGYVECNKVELFKNTLKAATASEFSLKQIISILHSVCLAEKLELIPFIKRAWPVITESRIFQEKLKNLCTHLIYLNKPVIAYELFKKFIDSEIGFVSEADTYASDLLHEMVKAKIPADVIIKIADDLIKTRRNTFALLKATEYSLRVPDFELALRLLETLHERNEVLRNHYFWPILIHEGRLNGEKGIFKIFRKMRDLKVEIEPETLEMYSLQYINNMDPEIIINRLKQFDLTATDTLSSLCVVVLFTGKIEQVANLTTNYKMKLDASKLIKSLATAFINTMDVKSTMIILKNIINRDNSQDWPGQLMSLILMRSGSKIDYDSIYELLKAFKLNEMKVSTSGMDKMIFLIKKIREKKTKTKLQKLLESIDISNAEEMLSHIPHPRNMTLDEMECHLIELKEKKLETRGILRKLINMHCRFGNVDRAMELFEEFESCGYKMSAGMKSSLLDLYIKSNNFRSALDTYQEIKEKYPTFEIDEFKIVELALLLYNNNLYEEAMTLLKNESADRTILGGYAIEHNCWKLLDTIAKAGNVTETKNVFQILTDCAYCTPSNVILGPLVRVHLCNNNAEEAVEEYFNCCLKYKKTPLMHELLCYLIKSESPVDLIKKVVETTAFIHGPVNSETSLIAALAETGMIQTLKKSFLELTQPLSESLMNQYCRRWVNEGKVNALNNIINCAPDNKVIDLTSVYYNLIRLHYSNNDSDKVLTLWNDMQEKNILPTTKIKSIVDIMLQNKKQSVDKQSSSS